MSNERKPHKHAEVIKAWADGEKIQFRHVMDRNGEWLEANMPCWLFDYDYRVKPEPVKARYRLMHLRDERRSYIGVCNDNGPFSPEDMEGFGDFVKWIHTEWQEVEVPQ